MYATRIQRVIAVGRALPDADESVRPGTAIRRRHRNDSFAFGSGRMHSPLSRVKVSNPIQNQLRHISRVLEPEGFALCAQCQLLHAFSGDRDTCSQSVLRKSRQSRAASFEGRTRPSVCEDRHVLPDERLDGHGRGAR